MKRALRWLAGILLGVLLVTLLLFLPVFGEIDVPRVTVPSSADSVTAAANAGYRTGPVGRFLLGAEYRQLWAEPVRAEVLDLDGFAGGLRPTREGGGQETRALHFEGKDGVDYTFRAVDKESHRLLQKTLSRTALARLVHDQTSSSWPAANLVALPLQEAIGLPASHPRLVVLADDPRLGAFRERFRGVLGTLQDSPESYVRLALGDRPVKETEAVLALADSGASNRLDARSYLAGRLLDLLLNDWDRHEGQWRWAAFAEPWGTRWFAVPVDRDRAFSWYDGVLLSVARLRAPELMEFTPEYPSLRGLIKTSRVLSARVLTELERRTWDSVAGAVAARLTDSVIDAAVGRAPPEHRQRAGERLATTLKQRRDRLGGIAERYYAELARHAAVHGTLEDDAVHLEYEAGGELVVRVARRADGGSAVPWFSRRFLPAETRSIDIYLGGGGDRVESTGTPSGAMTVRLLDAKGRILPFTPGGEPLDLRPR